MDANLKPYLIEVNHTPSFWTDSPLDLQVKRNLIIDTLHLINVNLKSKKKYKNLIHLITVNLIFLDSMKVAFRSR